MFLLNRDEDRDKCSDHLKSSSSEESVRKRRPSGNISINSQLSIFSQSSISTEADHAAIAAANAASSHPKPSIVIASSHPQNDVAVTSSVAIPKQTSHPQQQHQQQHQLNAASAENDFHYDTVDNVKQKYNYHDEPHSFENSMEFLEDFNHFQFEVLETTV